MIEEYIKEKIKEVNNMSQKELIEFMYKSGNLPEVEYEKYMAELEGENEN